MAEKCYVQAAKVYTKIIGLQRLAPRVPSHNIVGGGGGGGGGREGGGGEGGGGNGGGGGGG